MENQKKKSRTKTILKRVGLGFVALFVVLIGAAVAIPYFFKDEIVAKVQEEINKNVNAKVSFEDVNLSLFRSFPDFSFRLEGLEVMGVEEFEGLRLAGIKNFDIRLDLMKIYNGEYVIEGISLDEPNLYIKVLKNGKANYDIAKPSTDTTTIAETETDTAATDFLLQLESYSIKNGNVTYDDNAMNFYTDIENLNHSGTGDFSALVYDLKTKTTADALTVAFDGITYLKSVETDIDLDINVDMENMKFTIADNTIRMNALSLITKGFVAMPGDDINMDLAISSPKSDFKDLLSMIPAAYTADFDGVKASGKMGVDAVIKGIYNDNTLPSFKVNLFAENANFQYPDLPSSVKGINVKMNVNSPSSDLDKMVVDISKFNFEIEGSKVAASLFLKTPMSDPDIKATVDGKIVLDALASAFPLGEQGIQTLKGTIVANLKTNTKMSFVTDEKYEQVDMSGNFSIEKMEYLADGMPKVVINTMQMDFTPQNVKLGNFDALLGKSDLKMSGTLDNILTYFSGTKTMKGNLIVRSNKFDANEWLEGETTEANPNAPTANIEDTTTVAGESAIFDKFDFALDAEMKDITYDIYHIKNSVGKGNFTPNRMDFEELRTQVGKSDFLVQGSLENVFGYLFDDGTLGGSAIFRSAFMDANELMDIASPPTEKGGGEEDGAAPDSKDVKSGVVDDEVFGRFNVNADVKIDKLIYDTYKITNISGLGNFKHDIFQISNFGMQIGNSDLKASGTIQHAIDYMFNDGKVSGAIDLQSKFFDLNQFMTTEEVPATATSEQLPPAQPASSENIEPFLVPDNIDFAMAAKMDKVLYDKMTLNNVGGVINIKNESVDMSDVKADIFGGRVNVSGGYNTVDAAKPKFDFALDIREFFLNKAFDQLNTVQAIAPIAKFLEGKFNTIFKINGILGKDMMPDYKTLNSEGLLETLDATVKNFTPLTNIAKQINVKELEQLNIKNTKNTFLVKDGKVLVRPFDVDFKVKAEQIKMNIGGEHGINQDMDYDIKMTVPRALLEKNKATAAVNTGINLLSSQASKLGLNIQQGENINLLITLLGSISKPNIKVKLLGMDGSNTTVTDAVKGEVKDLTEEAKKRAIATADSLKRVAENKAKAEGDRIKADVQARADSLRKVAEQQAKDKLKSAADKAKEEALKKAKEVAGEEAAKAAEKLAKEKADKILKDNEAAAAAKKKAEEELNKLKNKFKNPLKKDN